MCAFSIGRYASNQSESRDGKDKEQRLEKSVALKAGKVCIKARQISNLA